MSRWFVELEKIREDAKAVTLKTIDTSFDAGSEGFEGSAAEHTDEITWLDAEVPKVLRVDGLGQTEKTLSDPDTLLALLRDHGPTSYGAAATTLAWGATRAWQAEAALREAGSVVLDGLGRMMIKEGTE